MNSEEKIEEYLRQLLAVVGNTILSIEESLGSEIVVNLEGTFEDGRDVIISVTKPTAKE